MYVKEEVGHVEELRRPYSRPTPPMFTVTSDPEARPPITYSFSTPNPVPATSSLHGWTYEADQHLVDFPRQRVDGAFL